MILLGTIRISSFGEAMNDKLSSFINIEKGKMYEDDMRNHHTEKRFLPRIKISSEDVTYRSSTPPPFL